MQVMEFDGRGNKGGNCNWCNLSEKVTTGKEFVSTGIWQ